MFEENRVDVDIEVENGVHEKIDEQEELHEYEKHEIETLKQSRSNWSLLALTIGFGGLQLVFALQFSYGSAYLVSTGLSKPVLGIIWAAAPVSGALVQPVIAMASDRCHSSWGRRRPFIVSGGGLIILALFGLGWAEELATIMALPFSTSSETTHMSTIRVCLSIFSFILLNVAIQPVQAGLRALTVDWCPAHQQKSSAAWAAVYINLANILSFFAGFLDLSRQLSLEEGSQFKVLCALTSIGLVVTLGICCAHVKEEPLLSRTKGAPFSPWSPINTFKNLSPSLRQIYKTQFFAWMGWCPFLFYISLHIASIFQKSRVASSISTDEASRTASFVLMLYAITSCISSLILPSLISTPRSKSYNREKKTPFSINLSMKRVWFLAHIFYAACMFSLFFVTSPLIVTIIVSLMGVSWTVNIWVPYALVGTEIHRVELDKEGDLDLELNESLLVSTSQPNIRGSASFGASHNDVGAVIGVLNSAIALPQILSTLLASALFWFLGDGGIKWVISSGGMAALVAAFMGLGIDEI